MDYTALARDESLLQEWRRRAFPFFQHKIFLTHASVSPLPQVAAQAVAEYSENIAREGQFDSEHAAFYRRCKEHIARLVGPTSEGMASADEVAMCSSTSHALGIVATAIDWRDGDNCVVADGDFPANVVVWKNLQYRHNIEVRMLPHRPTMDISVDDLARVVDEKTRLVSLCSANFLSGYPLDLSTLGAWLHERGILFCVDGIQTLGAVRFDATHVDFVCADSHKWLLGPNGAGFLWTRGSVLKNLRPAIFGWLSPAARDDWFAYDTTPIDSAERFEPGARNYLGAIALEASLALYEEVGAKIIEERVVMLRDEAARVLSELSCRLLWAPEPEKRAGIVSFQPPKPEQTAALYRFLEERLALSLRQDKNGADWIRVSAHWMNTRADMHELAEKIRVFLQRQRV